MRSPMCTEKGFLTPMTEDHVLILIMSVGHNNVNLNLLIYWAFTPT